MGESVGIRIRRLRKEAGLKQGELAKAAGIPQSTLSDIEHGRTAVPGGRISLKLARALHVHPDVLLSEGGDDVRMGHQSPEENELLGVFALLEPSHRMALLVAAKAMLDSQSNDSQQLPDRNSPQRPPFRRTS